MRNRMQRGASALFGLMFSLMLNLMLAGAVFAQPASRGAGPEIKPFSGTLQKIYESGVIRLGYRQNSPPFAFYDANRRPIGYALSLCEAVVEQIADKLHRKIDAQYVPVTPANRFDLVRDGSVDLECGSTTANAKRAEIVAFSPAMFVTGAKLAVRRDSGIRSLRDLQGKTIVLTKGTVLAEQLPQIAQRRGLKIDFIEAADHDESLQAVLTGKADAFANDDVQLAGEIAQAKAGAELRITGEFLTYADYALMLRRDDPEFAAVVRDAFEELNGSGRIRAIYRHWFQRPLPSGVNLNLPMSAHLEHVFQLQGLAAD